MQFLRIIMLFCIYDWVSAERSNSVQLIICNQESLKMDDKLLPVHFHHTTNDK